MASDFIAISELRSSDRQRGLLAIQSADAAVLEHAGRGRISLERCREQVDKWQCKGVKVATDLLIGLPGESADSQLASLAAAFNMGFDNIGIYNIRLLPGSDYETDAFRSKYQVRTKFRPIFGAYGTYAGRRVLEVEESVRATRDMSEDELNGFKVLHWLVYFVWNLGFFKPLLKYAREHGVNPAFVLHDVTKTENAILKKLFEELETNSFDEWFVSEKRMLAHFEDSENFNRLVSEFAKLNFLYVARVFDSVEHRQALAEELERCVEDGLALQGAKKERELRFLVNLSSDLVCQGLLDGEFSKRFSCPRSLLPALGLEAAEVSDGFGDVELEVWRSKESVDFAMYHLRDKQKADVSLVNVVRFLEIGGLGVLSNKVRVVG